MRLQLANRSPPRWNARDRRRLITGPTPRYVTRRFRRPETLPLLIDPNSGSIVPCLPTAVPQWDGAKLSVDLRPSFGPSKRRLSSVRVTTVTTGLHVIQYNGIYVRPPRRSESGLRYMPSLNRLLRQPVHLSRASSPVDPGRIAPQSESPK